MSTESPGPPRSQRTPDDDREVRLAITIAKALDAHQARDRWQWRVIVALMLTLILTLLVVGWVVNGVRDEISTMRVYWDTLSRQVDKMGQRLPGEGENP